MGDLKGLDLGRFGIYTFKFEDMTAEEIREAVQELEELGWGSIWYPELLGRESLTLAAWLLASGERVKVVSAIAQIWGREARWAQAAAELLADAYPDRHVMGLGFGGLARAGVAPVRAMADYLGEMDKAVTPNPKPATPVRRILGAYGPRMLRLARERVDGVQVYHANLRHTARAREIVGPDYFLAVEQAVLFEADRDRARDIARDHMAAYLASEFNREKFRQNGYSDADLEGGGSDHLLFDYVACGDLEEIGEKLNMLLAAGADHVGIQVIGTEGRSAMPEWRTLAEILHQDLASA